MPSRIIRKRNCVKRNGRPSWRRRVRRRYSGLSCGGAEYFPGPFGDDVGEPLYGALGRAGDEPEDGRDGVRLRKGRFHPTIEGSTANPDLYEKEPLACVGEN